MMPSKTPAADAPLRPRQLQLPPARPWRLLEAIAVLVTLQEPAKEAGYLLSMYGSTLTHGTGNDLDLVAFPWRFGVQPADLYSVMVIHGGCVPVGVPYRGAMETEAQGFQRFDGRVIDLQVRGVR